MIRLFLLFFLSGLFSGIGIYHGIDVMYNKPQIKADIESAYYMGCLQGVTDLISGTGPDGLTCRNKGYR